MTQRTGKSMTFSQEELEQCRAVPLHHVMGLTNINRRAKIVCPFHQEKTASCNLYPNDGRHNGGFHCFGCGKSGNSIDFLVLLGATLPQAVEELRKYI